MAKQKSSTSVLNIISDAFFSTRPKEWTRWVSLAKYWYKTNTHSATGLTPFEVIYGVPPLRLLSYVKGTTEVQEVDQVLKSREQILHPLKEHLHQAQHWMKQMADRHCTERSFEVGDWVFL